MRAIAVVESTHVAEVRREASQEATSLSFDATVTGRVALVATELATNVLKHGGGGEVLIGSYDDSSGSGVELIALDKGRGIADLQASLRDGHSSAGSAGQGLGAIRRQSQLMEVASWPGVGTAVLVRLGAQTAASATVSAPVALPAWFGSICVPLRGEQVCGDAVMCAATPAGRTMIVADGLGHGPEAARAAFETIRLFRQHQSRPLPELLEFIHAGLRSTRGVAVAVSRFALDGSKVTFGGIGNICGVTIGPSGLRRMVSLSGTAGHVARRIQVFDYPYGGAVVMHSDGLGSHWSLDRYPGLQQAHPSLVAAVLYRDFTRGRDDVAVLVGRGQESP